jgi:hypothetical protein
MKQYSKFMEALSAKQKKLDVNKNGKVDGGDLQKLRKEEACSCDCGESPCVECGKDHHDMKEGYVPSADMKPAKDGRMLPARKIQVNRDDKKKVEEEMTPAQKAARLALIKKTAASMAKRAEMDAKRAMRKDPDLKKPKKDPADHDLVHKEEVIAERDKANALKRKTMDAARGARHKLNNPVPDAEPEHKTPQQHNKAIGRALRNEATPNKKQVKQAIGIARDKRYAGGNMTGATKAMDKINKGLAQHPAVSKELQKQNEELDPAGSDLYYEELKTYKSFIKSYK